MTPKPGAKSRSSDFWERTIPVNNYLNDWNLVVIALMMTISLHSQHQPPGLSFSPAGFLRCQGMNISSQASTALLDSVLSAQSTQFEIGVTVLKKAQDVETQQGEAMIALLEQAASPPAYDGHLDVYA
jgi:hypothetical protein